MTRHIPDTASRGPTVPAQRAGHEAPNGFRTDCRAGRLTDRRKEPNRRRPKTPPPAVDDPAADHELQQRDNNPVSSQNHNHRELAR
jgi:hypothetical protein